MSDNKLIGELQDLGLTAYQSKAYVAAVRSGTATPNDLVDASDVPQGRIYDVLYDLEDMGLVEIRSRRRQKEVIAPAPEDVLSDLKRRRIDRLSDTIDTLSSELRRVHGEAAEISDDYVTMTGREETALRHIKQAIQGAEYWLMLAISPRIYRQVKPEIEDALAEGVTVRLLISGESMTASDGFFDGLSVRYRDPIHTMVAADRNYAIFGSSNPIQDTQPYLITQEFNIVQLLQDYSETVWGASQVVKSSGRFPRRYLDPRRAIIDLKDDLDAGTRFEATVEGHLTESREAGRWQGEVTDYLLENAVDVDFSLAAPIIASLTLDTEDGVITVGGWRATVEDVGAVGIEIDRISE